MKATLEFNLPQELPELQVASESQKWQQLIYDIKVEIQRLTEHYILSQNQETINTLAELKWFIKDKQAENNLEIKTKLINSK